MSRLHEIREQRGELAGQIRQLADRINHEKRDFRSDEKAQWEKVNREYDRLTTEARKLEIEQEHSRLVGDRTIGRDDFRGNANAKASRGDRVVHTEEQRSHAFRAWVKSQVGHELTGDEKRACKALRFNPHQTQQLRIPLWSNTQFRNLQNNWLGVHPERRIDMLRKEVRANMSGVFGSSGGYLVPPASLQNALEINLLAFGGVRQVAEVINTNSGEPLLWPTADDTTNLGEQLGENTSIGSGTNPTLGQKRWDAYKFSSKPILVPSELLEDSAFDLPAYIGEMLGVRIGRITAQKFAVGTGASTPEGIITGASSGVTTASATAIKADDLFKLVHAVDPAYRSMPGVGWLMHDNVVLYLRQLKDGQGNYLWKAGLQDGVADRLLGYPVQVCQEMDSSVATGKKTVLFGALKQYKIRRVNEIRMFRLQERYRDYDQDGFVAFERCDGKLLDAGTAPVKYIVQA